MIAAVSRGCSPNPSQPPALQQQTLVPNVVQEIQSEGMIIKSKSLTQLTNLPSITISHFPPK